jgi:hypothetical protein
MLAIKEIHRSAMRRGVERGGVGNVSTNAGRRCSESRVPSGRKELAFGGSRGEGFFNFFIGGGDFNNTFESSKDCWILKINIIGITVVSEGCTPKKGHVGSVRGGRGILVGSR